ncbi:MAG: DNA translocase FtsK [Clostridia bacterium]|nr:DNA translocase FtsK [Clostridia bacterium]
MKKTTNKKPEKKKAPQKNTTKKTGESQKKRAPQKRDSSALIHQILPYIFGLSAFFIALCLILVNIAGKTDSMGFVGKLISGFFCGFFGGGAFLVPVLLFYLAIVWRRSIDCGQAGYKIAFSVIAMLLSSALIHVCALDEHTFNPVTLWKNGLAGGGVLGGWLGQLSYLGLRVVGSLIVIPALLLIDVMFLFGVTPDHIVLYFRYRRKMREERRAEGGDPAFVNKPKYTDEDFAPVSAQEAEAGVAQAKNSRRKRKYDVDIDPDLETGATASDLGLEYSDSHTERRATEPEAPDSEPVLNEAPFEDGPVPETTPEMKAKDEEFQRELTAGLDALFGNTEAKTEPMPLPEIEPETAPAPEKQPVQAESDDVFLRQSKSDISELPKKPIKGEQIRAEIYPPVTLLAEDKGGKQENFTAELRQTAEKLQETLLSFNVKTKIVGYSRGPTVTRYELQPEVGTRVRSISNLVDDIALNLAASGVRIEAPIPGKSAVGIEVPNRTSSTVYLRTLLESPKFVESKSNLTACLGADVAGNPIIFDIAKMPHLLIAGATGMGKSVCINSIIMSLLYKALPRDVRLLLIDPKKVEFGVYRDIPHLIAPIVSDPKKSAGALVKMVEEMERRFELIEEVGVRDLKSYNELTKDDPDKEYLPQIVIIIDELADLMMTTPQDVENSICRLAQKARAAGMHIIVGTQRPSVDVITGLIKANIPSRIAFTVASQVDSRTIINIAGAEKLIGRGDMLYAPVGASKPMRVQGSFVSDSEVEAVCDYIKTNTGKAEYDDNIVNGIEEAAARLDAGKKGASDMPMGDGDDQGGDPTLRRAIELAVESGKISTSLIQRRMSLGYGRAAKLIDRMEEMGIVSPQDGQKPREVLITKQQFMEMVVNDTIS